MRNRTLTFNPRELVIPVVIVVAIALAVQFLLSPGLGAGRTADQSVIRIYSSVPMDDYISIVHGVAMALEEVNYQVGEYKIDYVPLNGARQLPDGNWRWNPELELANARRAAADPDAMIYIGTYNSGAAKVSIPVLNRVHMAMISPGNTYPGLTKPGTGVAGEPWAYYPLGIRNYFRVVPADDLQGSAAAAYAREIGARSVYVLDDTELYGKGIATIFARSARDLGLEVLSGDESVSIDVRLNDYTALATQIVQAQPDLVYFGGITANHPALVLRDLRKLGYAGAFMGADGIADDTFIEQATGFDIGEVYSTLVGLPAAEWQGPGAEWYSRYVSRFPEDNAKDFAPFGYEAGRVAISAINRAGVKDREAIRAAVASTTSTDLGGEPILGEWSFDANGDTSLVTISVQRLSGQWAYEGLMSYDPQATTWSFQSGR